MMRDFSPSVADSPRFCCENCEYQDLVRSLVRTARALSEITHGQVSSPSLDAAVEMLEDAIDQLAARDGQSFASISQAIRGVLDYLHEVALVASLQIRDQLIDLLPALRHSVSTLATVR